MSLTDSALSDAFKEVLTEAKNKEDVYNYVAQIDSMMASRNTHITFDYTDLVNHIDLEKQFRKNTDLALDALARAAKEILMERFPGYAESIKTEKLLTQMARDAQSSISTHCLRCRSSADIGVKHQLTPYGKIHRSNRHIDSHLTDRINSESGHIHVPGKTSYHSHRQKGSQHRHTGKVLKCEMYSQRA